MTSEASPSAPTTPGAPAFEGEKLPRQFGKYTLLRTLASGGMAQVYLAIQRAVAGFEKLVVVKRILPELARNASFVEMLLAEARTAATLNHPNVVQTFDVGEVEGTYFIAMEHIHGEDIRSIVRGMREKAVAEFPREHALTIVNGVCAGLGYAHEKRGLGGDALDIVHRDISPQNILITFSGDVKIVDFGIAKSTSAVEVESKSSGQIKGKVPYMSPEQARGATIDHRSDIFAVGILLFELTTGRRLFKAKNDLDTLKLICDREYPRPSQVRPGYPPALEAIVMRALEKDRDKRYQRCRDMQADLEAFIREERIAASTVELGNWMNFLFEEKINQQKAVLQDAKQLADMIAQQHLETSNEWMMSTTMGATAVTGADLEAVSVIKARQRRHWMLLAVAGLAVVGGGTMVALRAKKEREAAALAAQQQAPTAEPEPKRGTLKITSEPGGAYVRIAGELQGQKTPVSLDKLPLGMDIEVKISKEGFEDHVASIKLSEEKLEDAIAVKLMKGTVTVVADVEPREATFLLDEKAVPLPQGGWSGQNKLEELSAGDHKALFSAPGYLPELVKFTTKKGETKTLTVRLKKGDPTALAKKGDAAGASSTQVAAPPPPAAGGRGTVNVASAGGYCAQTLVNGKSVGPTPVAGISVAAGPVSVVCKTADGKTYGGGGQVKDGETARIRVVIPK